MVDFELDEPSRARAFAQRLELRQEPRPSLAVEPRKLALQAPAAFSELVRALLLLRRALPGRLKSHPSVTRRHFRLGSCELERALSFRGGIARLASTR